MTIRRIQVAFVGPDGVPRGQAQGSFDRRPDLVREARAELERYRAAARREGDLAAEAEFTLSITDAPASATWRPKPS